MSGIGGKSDGTAETRLFIRYAVPEEEQAAATRLLDGYRDNLMVLRLLSEHYRNLPEACEEAVIRIAEIARRQGVFLFAAVTAGSAFLYVVSSDAVVYLGPYRIELEQELLDFFGFSGQQDYLARCPPVGTLRELEEDASGLPVCCPVCGVAEAESHLLGCSVEICPWCDGQLTSCGCRFTQLQLEEIETDEHLAAFERILVEKGRIAFQAEHRPAYPGTSSGLDKG